MSNPAKTDRTQNETWSLAWQFARCELRHSVMRFRIFLAALMLGVAAIGAVGSVAEMQSLVLSNNSAEQGGALWLNRDASELDGLDISSNEAEQGGGLYIENSITHLKDNTIILHINVIFS